jgi:hypothetical protein
MRLRDTLKWVAGFAGAVGAAYGTYAAVAWNRYGHPRSPTPEEADPLLDRFMPHYDVAERHHVTVAAPAAVTFEAACAADLLESPIIRAIFRTREIVLRSQPDPEPPPRGVLAMTTAIGWGVLAEIPGREIVMGSVTKPWEADVVFRPLDPDAFIAFDEPGYVKIAWTLRADPIDAGTSVFRHETRVWPTDAGARRLFRSYWSRFSPGIKMIRWLLLDPIRREAERRAGG